MYRLMIILLAFVVIAGCGVLEMNGSIKGNTNGQGGPSEGDVNRGINAPIAVELVTELDVRKENNKLLFDITLTNRGEDTIELPFSSGQQFEIIVKNEEDEEVYRYSKGRMFTQALSFIELKAGEKLSWSDEWDKKLDNTWVPNGEYKVTAEVLVQDSEGSIIINQEGLTSEKMVTLENEAQE